MQNQIMGTVIKLFIVSMFFFSCQNRSEGLIFDYMLDIKTEELSAQDLLLKYYPSSKNDSTAKKTIIGMLKEKRTWLKNIDLVDLDIIEIEKENQSERLDGLKWESGIFLVYYKKKYLMPFLIKDHKIVSTIIISKGKRKYFLQL